ncbi:MAG TPA: hypothetical protein VMZ91_16320 [Candidatus Paceibacterota bacterium]|nr:hypothetical protein [Candidatus Paceibacterota bacterium]
MKDKCKCKNPNKYSVIEGIGIRCERCLNWIGRFRKGFHRKTQIRKTKKVYNRKRKLEEE